VIEDESLSTAEQSMNILRHIALISQHGEKWKYRQETDGQILILSGRRLTDTGTETKDPVRAEVFRILIIIVINWRSPWTPSRTTESSSSTRTRARLSAVNINNGLRKKEEIHK